MEDQRPTEAMAALFLDESDTKFTTEPGASAASGRAVGRPASAPRVAPHLSRE